MPEKKNIVIKVKYPSPGKSLEKLVSGPPVITEWNYKRIGLALGSLLLVMLMWFYTSDDGEKKNLTTETTEVQLSKPAQPAAVTPQPQPVQAIAQASTKPLMPVTTSKAVARSQLTRDINKNEPVDKLKLPLKIGKKETLWIYYFVELKGLVGQAVYHEWWLNGNLVSRKKVNISDDPWRTASKQMITYTTNNNWIVRVVDEGRNTLAENSFNLELN